MPEATVAYFKGDFRPIEDATISIRSKALNYGLGVFEGIRAYWCSDDEQLYIFRCREHYARLKHSCKIVGLTLGLGVEEMVEITTELLRRNGHREDTYVRPIVFNNSYQLSPIMTANDTEFGMYTLPLSDYLDTSKGVTACVSSWHRVADNMIPARAKPTAAYLNSALARGEAKANGFDEAIMLTQGGYISEASAEHLFLVMNGRLVTPTSQDDNLDGITRKTILEIVPAELGVEVETRRVSRTELYVADEAFLCGTGAQVTPLTSIDRRPVGNGEVGDLTRRLQELYLRVVKNKVEAYSAWCTPVY